nr:hypothetical protein [uncultured Mediterranean phage uvMED]
MALVKYNNNSISAVTSASSIPSGAMTHIKTLTASASATLSFVNGSSSVVLDSTYPIYLFKFINVSATSGATTPNFSFNGSDDTSSHSYDIVKTTTTIQAYHKEDGSNQSLFYNTSFDLAQSTAFQQIGFGDGNTDADASGSGELYLFNPSSTTFVKHFIADFNNCASDPSSENDKVAGYFNTTSPITAMQFKYDNGNIDAGTIKLYGIKDS